VHGALLDDKVQTNCNSLHFAQSWHYLCLNDFLSVLQPLYHLFHFPPKRITRIIYHLFSISLHSSWSSGQQTRSWMCWPVFESLGWV
jgi:hypothetical protein